MLYCALKINNITSYFKVLKVEAVSSKDNNNEVIKDHQKIFIKTCFDEIYDKISCQAFRSDQGFISIDNKRFKNLPDTAGSEMPKLY